MGQEESEKRMGDTPAIVVRTRAQERGRRCESKAEHEEESPCLQKWALSPWARRDMPPTRQLAVECAQNVPNGGTTRNGRQ